MELFTTYKKITTLERFARVWSLSVLVFDYVEELKDTEALQTLAKLYQAIETVNDNEAKEPHRATLEKYFLNVSRLTYKALYTYDKDIRAEAIDDLGDYVSQFINLNIHA